MTDIKNIVTQDENRKVEFKEVLPSNDKIIINAIVHRDYSILGSDIKIAIFDDCIEITSPGELIISKEKLGKGYSELRNPNLGNLLKRFEIVEQWGTGFEKINHQLKEYPENINKKITASLVKTL